MKVGIYTRVSTDLQVQRGESLDEQLHDAKSYCKYKNIPIANTYREEGRSGKNTDRPELKKLLRDCKRGKINTVIVKKLDRLSRSILDFEKILCFFEEYEITLISLKESFDTSSPMSRAAVRIVLVFAQLEREQTSERTRDAMIYRAKRGIWNGGHLPIGYDLSSDRKSLILNQEEAKIVVLIFEKYIELASYKKVSQYINSQGYRTKRCKTTGGKEFVDTSIARIIQNPVYLGKISYKGEVYSASHSPIISEELFNKAQEVRKSNHKKNGNLRKENKHNFILEGLVWCDECKSQMTPLWSNGRNKRYFYYACTKSIHSGKHSCSTRTVNAHAIEQLVLNRTRSMAKDDNLFKQVMDNNDQANREHIKELKSEEKTIQEKITHNDKKVMAVTEVFSTAINEDREHVMAREIDRLNNERKILVERQIQVRMQAADLENITISKEAVKEILISFNEMYRPLSSYEKKYLLSQLIHSIKYNKDNITIRYYVLPDIDILSIPKEKALLTSRIAGNGSQRLPLGSPNGIRTRV